MDIMNNRILKSEGWQVYVYLGLGVDGRWYWRVFKIDVEQGNKGEEEKGELKRENRSVSKVSTSTKTSPLGTPLLWLVRKL